MKIFRLTSLLFIAGWFACAATAADIEKSSWHGFDRYDYVINEETLQLTPTRATAREGDGVNAPEPGTRRCIVVVPRQALPGNPWTWRGCYWNHEPQAEIELLNRGYHVAFITTDPDRTWDVWYAFLTREYGLSPKPAFIGMSRGGSNAYTWGTNNPDKVTAIYADNPGVSQTSLSKLYLLAQNDVPLLNVCGSIDPILNNTRSIENIYHAWGGRISVIVKDGPAHHPHSLRDPGVIVDFIEQSFAPGNETKPAFLTERNTRTSFYSSRIAYDNKYAAAEKVWTTVRGAFFVGSYDRYGIYIPGVGGGVTVFVPGKAAAGMPWVYRTDQPERDSEVDFALLAEGYHIVVGPVPTSEDGPNLEHWNTVYGYLTEKGFSKKPVVAGRGAATGEVYHWAINNPEKVSCIYGENPILRASLASVQPLDNLAPLARAGVPVLHVCGSLDPNLKSQTRAAESKYRQFGGKFTVIEDRGKGHYPLSPLNPQQAVDFILKNTR
ncbi:MAG: alpha/beta hydrolase [Tannerella sp.]|jgi:pimeloyl-ACP methyl ester carboxylesterase|nr:alpha/beta hydrolase [Tannerella sp.]